jgi:hypothetical protein
MSDDGKSQFDIFTGLEYEKYTFNTFRCRTCGRRIKKKLIDASQCPLCDKPLVVEVVPHTGRRRKWRIIRPNWHMGLNHPDYDYAKGYRRPPEVNLICVRCNAIFQNAVLEQDFQIWADIKWSEDVKDSAPYSKLYAPDACPDTDKTLCGSGKQLVKVICPACDGKCKEYTVEQRWLMCSRCEGTGVIGVIKEWESIKSNKKSRHDLRVLHRLISVKPAGTENRHCVIFDISSYLSVEIYLGENKTVVYEGGAGMVVDERGTTARTTGTCFLPPPGFISNPVEEMDDETVEEVFNGLMAKNREKVEKLRAEGPPQQHEYAKIKDERTEIKVGDRVKTRSIVHSGNVSGVILEMRDGLIFIKRDDGGVFTRKFTRVFKEEEWPQ